MYIMYVQVHTNTCVLCTVHSYINSYIILKKFSQFFFSLFFPLDNKEKQGTWSVNLKFCDIRLEGEGGGMYIQLINLIN